MAAVAAALFDELGWSRYAEICRSGVTSEVHASFERSSKVGHAAASRAENRSGVLPPNLDDFSFGHLMGSEELATRVLVSRSLEHAVTTRDLVVGRSGWRSQQRAITAAVLDTPHPEQPTQSFRSAVITERLERWVEAAQQRSPQLGDLRARYADRLLRPNDPPSDVAARLGPFLWLLDVTGQPSPPLDDYPDDPVVRTLAAECHRRQWWGRDVTPPRNQPEDDVPGAAFLLGLGRSTGAVVQRGGRHVLTSTGRRMLDDPVVAWNAMVARLGGGDLLSQTVVEIATLVLLDEPEGIVHAGDLWHRIADMAIELGWRSLAEPVADITFQMRLHGTDWWLFHSITFGLLVVADTPGPYLQVAEDSPMALTPSGETTLLTYISRLATGPVTQTFPRS